MQTTLLSAVVGNGTQNRINVILALLQRVRLGEFVVVCWLGSLDAVNGFVVLLDAEVPEKKVVFSTINRSDVNHVSAIGVKFLGAGHFDLLGKEGIVA